MINKKIAFLTLVTTPLLFACGGSSSSSNSNSDNQSEIKASIEGTWLSPSCQMGEYYSDTDSFDYKRQKIIITNSVIRTLDITYSDNDCTLVINSDEKEVTLTDEGPLVGADTGLEMRKLATSGLPNKWLAYVNPNSTHLILTPGSTEYPTQINLEKYYVKQGADFSAKATGSNITVLGHFGLNLKTGLSEQSEATHDISTTQWSPSNEYIAGESYGSGIWLRDYSQDEYLYVYPTEITAFSEVTEVPSNWFVKYTSDKEQAVDKIPSVKKGEVNIVKLRDGSYAKLKVLNTPNPDSNNWSLLVEYQLFN